jgi:hypothetical protein
MSEPWLRIFLVISSHVDYDGACLSFVLILSKSNIFFAAFHHYSFIPRVYVNTRAMVDQSITTGGRRTVKIDLASLTISRLPM